MQSTRYLLLPDPHLGHRRLQEEQYGNRPDNFEELILNNLAATVRPMDVVIVLGDFSLYKDGYWHDRFMAVCGCKRWLLLGNHDRKSKGWYMSHGWDCVADELLLDVYGKRILLSHAPVIDRDGFDFNIHGHEHNSRHHNITVSGKNILLYLEHHYKPIDLRRLIEEVNYEKSRS